MICHVWIFLEILCVHSFSPYENLPYFTHIYSYYGIELKGGRKFFPFSRMKREETPSCEDQIDGKVLTKVTVKRSFNFEPWLVYIKSEKEEKMCAGALISPEWIATTGFCLNDNSGKAFVVFNNKKDQYRLIDYFIVHDDYNIQNIDNDIALLKIQEPFLINRDTFSTCIQNPKENISCKNTCEVGVSSGAPSRVSLMDWESCKRFFENLGNGERLTNNEECLTAPAEHFTPFDYCTGLTGSPLTCHGRDGERVLSGILSLGWTCIHPKSPAVFTKISKYHEWITTVINSNGGTSRNFHCSRPTGNRFVKEIKGDDRDYRLDVFIPRVKGSEERIPRYDHLRDLSEYMQMKDIYGKYVPLPSNYFKIPNPVKPHYLQGEAPIGEPTYQPTLYPPPLSLPPLPQPALPQPPVLQPPVPQPPLPQPPLPQPPLPQSPVTQPPVLQPPVPQPPVPQPPIPQPPLLPPPLTQQPFEELQPPLPQPSITIPTQNLLPPPMPDSGVGSLTPQLPDSGVEPPPQLPDSGPQPPVQEDILPPPVLPDMGVGGADNISPKVIFQQPEQLPPPQPPPPFGEGEQIPPMQPPPNAVAPPPPDLPPIPPDLPPIPPDLPPPGPGLPQPNSVTVVHAGPPPEPEGLPDEPSGEETDIENILAVPIIKIRKQLTTTRRPTTYPFLRNCSDLTGMSCVPINQTVRCGDKGDKICFPTNKTISHYLFRFRGDPANQRPAHDFILKSNKKLNLNLVKAFKLMVKLERVK